MKKNHLGKFTTLLGLGLATTTPIILSSCSNTPKSINILEKLKVVEFNESNIPTLDEYPQSDGSNAASFQTDVNYDLYDNGYNWLRDISPLYTNALNANILISEVYGTLVQQAQKLHQLIGQIDDNYQTKLASFNFAFKKFNYYQNVNRVDLSIEISLTYNNSSDELDHTSKIVIEANQANGWYDVLRSDNPGATFSYPCLKIQGGVTIDGQTTSKGIPFCYYYKVDQFKINLDYDKK